MIHHFVGSITSLSDFRLWYLLLALLETATCIVSKLDINGGCHDLKICMDRICKDKIAIQDISSPMK
jgi:hypothetical protein